MKTLSNWDGNIDMSRDTFEQSHQYIFRFYCCLRPNEWEFLFFIASIL